MSAVVIEASTSTAIMATDDPVMAIAELGSIIASLTNPRKTFDQATLQELAESIKESGVHQAILVRPLPASRLEETSRHNRVKSSVFGWPFAQVKKPVPILYELVAGERRWRACQLAGVDTIPVMIRKLTDEQALAIQFVENLQREDVSDLETAEGLQYLMTTAGMTAEEVAKKIKKSRRFVFNRTKLLDLCQVGRTAMREGKLDFSKALLVSRIPSESQQLKAIKDLTETGYDGEHRIGTRKAAEYIREHYMLELKKAPFSREDAELVPSAGACINCPKRTGANPELYDDVKSADVCTDAPCYHKKEEAHTLRLAEEAKAKGQNVITGDEAKELVAGNSYYHSTPKLKGYRRLDHSDDSPTDQPLRKIIGKQMRAEGIEPTKIENPRKAGEFIDCLPNEVANRLIKTVEAAAKAEGAKAVTKEVQKMMDDKKAKAEARAKAQYEQAWRDQLLARAWAEVNTGDFECFSLEVHRYVLRREAASLSVEDAEAIAEILGLGKVGAHSAVIDQCKTTEHPDILHLLIIMQRASAADDYGYKRPANEGLMLVAGAALADRLPVVIRDVQAAAKAKYLSAPVESAAPKGASTPSPAAHATTTRATTKSKKGPAAQAPATAPKTSTKEASAQIAAELSRIESQNQAPTAQGNEGQAVADAQPGTAPSGSDGVASEAADQAPAAQGDEAPPAAPAPATPAPSTKASASSKKGAASTETTPAPAAAVAIVTGVGVRVSADVYAADKQIYAGKRGTVVGPLKGFKNTWRVTFDQADVGEASPSASFKAAELVVVTAEQAQAEAAPPAAEPVYLVSGTVMRIKEGARGPDGKKRKSCGRVGVLGNSGSTGLILVFGQRRDQMVAQLDAQDLERYLADPVIGDQVRVLKIGPFRQPPTLLWRTGKVVGVSQDGWMVEFTAEAGEPELHTFEPTELEVIKA